MTNVVIVDDEPHIAAVLRYLLEDEGYQVVVAGNGREALESIRRDRPDLVLSDLMMPGLDGWDLARAIKSDPALATVRVVLMSAGAAKESTTGLCTAFVRKPFDLVEILQLVESYTPRAGRGSDTPCAVLDGDSLAARRSTRG